MITKNNQIALKWVLPRNPQPVKIDGTDRIYTFVPKMNVFMAWVNSDDAPRMLKTKAKVCNCNNGTFKIAFEYANYLDVLLWETGSRDGQLNSNYVVEE